MDIDNIYEMLHKQGETLATIAQSQVDTKERLFGANGQPGALHFLQTEISETQKIVSDHTSKFTFYRGAVAVLTFLWSAGVALAAVVLNRHK